MVSCLNKILEIKAKVVPDEEQGGDIVPDMLPKWTGIDSPPGIAPCWHGCPLEMNTTVTGIAIFYTSQESTYLSRE